MRSIVRGFAALAVLLLVLPVSARADVAGGGRTLQSIDANHDGHPDFQDSNGDGVPDCGQLKDDRAQVAAVRTAADEQCDCKGSDSHFQYLVCVSKVAKTAVRAGVLRAECFDKILKCANKSTCGKDENVVTCCMTDADGHNHCALRKNAAECKPVNGGTACVTDKPSCCDACGPRGCGGSTTTTTPRETTTSTTTPTSSTTTTTQGPFCGDGIVQPDRGEQCDPPGSVTCPAGSPVGALLECLQGCVCPGPTTTTMRPPTTTSSTTTSSTTATTATTTSSTTATTATTTTATTATTTSSTTATTATTTTSTTAGPVCGNGIVEAGEQCDPPGSATCPSGSPGGAMLDCLAGCVCPAPTTTSTAPPTTTTSTTATTTSSTTATTATTTTSTTATTTSSTTATTATTTTSTTATTATTTSSTTATTATTTTSTTATTTSSTTATTATTTTSTTATTTSSTTTTSTTATTTTTLCSCCPGPNSLLQFTNTTGTGNCGEVRDAGGNLLFDLVCGGLYTGAGASTLTQPAAPPDMGTEYVRPTACTGTSFTIAPTVPADLTGVAGNHRNCTSAGIADPDYPACVGGTNVGRPCVTNADCPSSTCTSTMPGCLFGAPLAIPNPGFTGASVCVVNRVQTSASGSGDCQSGATNLSLPLSSDLYLTGDLLDGSAPDRPNVPGIQPCPLCNPSTNLCQGGPRNGLACHPDTSALNAAYPTSHDCPPPPGPLGANYIGALPVPFNLTTDPSGTTAAEHKVANNTNLSGQEVFCGFCGAQFSPTFHNPPLPCMVDADCAGVTGCPNATACNRCKQRDSGAFGPSVSPAPGSEHEITLRGAAAGECLASPGPHAATLVSAFCIPPAFNATVDANGDLPGPGAVSLPGHTTLIP